jgi:Protein of unknown function (DUF664)
VTAADLLIDAFGRIRGVVHHVVEGLSPEQLSFRLEDKANSIAWLVWHLTRIQDDHIADAADTGQVWTSNGWSARFALPFDDSATGYGHSSDQVAAVQVASGELLTGYHDVVFEKTIRFVKPLTEADLARIIDESWDPPVSLGVRLVSVVSDDLQHAGQAALVRGIVTRQ